MPKKLIEGYEARESLADAGFYVICADARMCVRDPLRSLHRSVETPRAVSDSSGVDRTAQWHFGFSGRASVKCIIRRTKC